MTGYLVDTNVLVYLYDPTDGGKRARAMEALERLEVSQEAFLSTQVLGEFFSTITRRIPSPLSAIDAAHRVENYVESWNVCDISAFTVLEAVRGTYSHQLPYYDSLIWATARLNQISNILTEDGQHNRLIEGVRYLNPFHAEFDLETLAPRV